MVQQTSMQALWEIKNLGQRQARVYQVIHDHGPISNLEIAEKLDVPINSITPRTNELVELGKVCEAYRDPSPITGRKTIFWMIK